MNALMASIFKQVVEKTGQSYLIDATKSAILHATRDLHITRFFERDCESLEYEAEIPEEAEGAVDDSISLTSIPRFRELVSVECITASGEVLKAKRALGYVSSKVFASSPADSKALYAKTGATVKLATRDPVVGFAVVAVVFPDLTEDGFNSWIAELYPSVVVYKAAAAILGEIGDSSAMNAMLVQYNRALVDFYHDARSVVLT